MLVRDTNVVSERMKKYPNPEVPAWLDRERNRANREQGRTLEATLRQSET